MSRALRITFVVHAVIAAIAGALLLLIPGRFLGWLGWAPIDPLLTRVLGAAMLALGWGSYCGWRAADRTNVSILVQVDAIFCSLSAVGLLRHLLKGNWPPMVWILFAAFAVFALVWLFFLVKRGE